MQPNFCITWWLCWCLVRMVLVKCLGPQALQTTITQSTSHIVCFYITYLDSAWDMCAFPKISFITLLLQWYLKAFLSQLASLISNAFKETITHFFEIFLCAVIFTYKFTIQCLLLRSSNKLSNLKETMLVYHCLNTPDFGSPQNPCILSHMSK